jgi:hypothetical protein
MQKNIYNMLDLCLCQELHVSLPALYSTRPVIALQASPWQQAPLLTTKCHVRSGIT